MKKWTATIAVAAALWLGLPAPAHAATNIECMDSGYTEQENSEFERFLSRFTLNGWAQNGLPPNALAALSGHAGDCADQNDWQPDAIEQAIRYRTAVLLQDALQRNTTLTAPQFRRLAATIAGADQARLTRIFGPALDAVLIGREAPEPSREDTMYIGNLILRSGIPATQPNAEFAGAWLASTVMKNQAVSRFAAH